MTDIMSYFYVLLSIKGVVAVVAFVVMSGMAALALYCIYSALYHLLGTHILNAIEHTWLCLRQMAREMREIYDPKTAVWDYNLNKRKIE